MKIGGIHWKSVIFTTFHHFGGQNQEKCPSRPQRLPFKAQNISRNWHSRNPLRRKSAVSRPEMFFRAKSILRGKVWFSRKCRISRKRWFRTQNPSIWSSNSQGFVDSAVSSVSVAQKSQFLWIFADFMKNPWNSSFSMELHVFFTWFREMWCPQTLL